jgi:hypothetical protein
MLLDRRAEAVLEGLLFQTKPADFVVQRVQLVLGLLEEPLGLDARSRMRRSASCRDWSFSSADIRCAVTKVSWRVRSRSLKSSIR